MSIRLNEGFQNINAIGKESGKASRIQSPGGKAHAERRVESEQRFAPEGLPTQVRYRRFFLSCCRCFRPHLLFLVSLQENFESFARKSFGKFSSEKMFLCETVVVYVGTLIRVLFRGRILREKIGKSRRSKE